MIRCKDCKFWGKDTGKKRRECSKIKMKSPILLDLLFLVVEFKHPTLASDPDFGCILGKARDHIAEVSKMVDCNYTEPQERLDKICTDWNGTLKELAGIPDDPGLDDRKRQYIAESKRVDCPDCEGSGKQLKTKVKSTPGKYDCSMSARMVVCPTCNGTGKVTPDE